MYKFHIKITSKTHKPNGTMGMLFKLTRYRKWNWTGIVPFTLFPRT